MTERSVRLYELARMDPAARARLMVRSEEDLQGFIEAVKPILRALDTGDTEMVRDHIRTAADHWGKILFEVLFGTEADDQEKIFRTAFHQPPPAAAPTAIRAPLHLRIATGSPDLLGLPWRLTSWNGRLLINDGWVISTGVSEDPDTDCVTPAPSEVLLVAPKAATGMSASGAPHLEAIEQLLRTIWPSNRESSVRRVRTTVELGNALQGQRPHLVYVCAPCEAQRGARLHRGASRWLDPGSCPRTTWEVLVH